MTEAPIESKYLKRAWLEGTTISDGACEEARSQQRPPGSGCVDVAERARGSALRDDLLLKTE